MNRILGILVLILINVQADYKLVLIDESGNQTQECIKSYSFSNNLESISRQNGLTNESFSLDETLTNKTWVDGKPIYRRVFFIEDVRSYNAGKDAWIAFANNIDMETVITDDIVMINPNYRREGLNTDIWYVQVDYRIDTKEVRMNTNWPAEWPKENVYVVFEYTKPNDSVTSASNSFKSYLHYIPSSSQNDEVKTIDLKEKGVQFLEGYSYDSLLDSCEKPQ